MCVKRTSRAQSAKSLAAGVQGPLWGCRCSLMQSQPYFGPFETNLKLLCLLFFLHTHRHKVKKKYTSMKEKIKVLSLTLRWKKETYLYPHHAHKGTLYKIKTNQN